PAPVHVHPTAPQLGSVTDDDRPGGLDAAEPGAPPGAARTTARPSPRTGARPRAVWPTTALGTGARPRAVWPTTADRRSSGRGDGCRTHDSPARDPRSRLRAPRPCPVGEHVLSGGEVAQTSRTP